MKRSNDYLKLFVVGCVLGSVLTVMGGFFLHKLGKGPDYVLSKGKKVQKALKRLWPEESTVQVVEEFAQPMRAEAGKSFGKDEQLTFELFRGGTFRIDGESGDAWQKSEHYGDVAIIRSTEALPKTYKISVVVGDIDYDLERIVHLPNDSQYTEGPQNENGCYLIAITDQKPSGHHTNTWWHQHRKIVIDVDNNAWGHGMPNPIFMVYFDKNNKLVSYDGEDNAWQKEWKKAVTYQPDQWYRVEVEKTAAQFILSVYNDAGDLLKRSKINHSKVWQEDAPEYFVIGDPHENYYQGSMKIRSVSLTVKKK